MRTLDISLFSTAGVISSTWTVIRVSAATLLYAAILPVSGVSNSATNGWLSRATTWKACITLSSCDTDEGGWRDDSDEGGRRDDTDKGGWRDPASSRRAAVRLPNRNAKRAVRFSEAVPGAFEGPANEGGSPNEEDGSSVFSSATVSIVLPTRCRSRRSQAMGERGKDD